MKVIGNMEIIQTHKDIVRLNGQQAEVVGRYHAVERPIKGITRKPRPKDHALLELEDGTKVYLEPFESPDSQRPPKELSQFDGKRVRVTGIAYKFMPARAESPLAPCVAEITQIAEGDLAEGTDK
jgi:hypothetical protein